MGAKGVIAGSQCRYIGVVVAVLFSSPASALYYCQQEEYNLYMYKTIRGACVEQTIKRLHVHALLIPVILLSMD